MTSHPMEFETARTVVYPWQCDSMGHLATQHYMKVFDDASYNLLGVLGYSLPEGIRTRRGWADASHAIEYRRELLEGSLLFALSCVTRLGRTSITYRTRLMQVGCETAESALLTGVMVYFDLEQRRPLELPEELRRRAAQAFQLG